MAHARFALGTIREILARALLACVLAGAAFAEAQTLSAPDSAAQVQAGQIVLIDIRSPEEWAETGVAEGAWPLTMHSREFPAQLQAILAQHAPEQVALICATGGRSGYIANILAQNGISGIVDVSEGMLGNGRAPGWIARGLPLVAADDAIARFDALRQSWD